MRISFFLVAPVLAVLGCSSAPSASAGAGGGGNVGADTGTTEPGDADTGTAEASTSDSGLADTASQSSVDSGSDTQVESDAAADAGSDSATEDAPAEDAAGADPWELYDAGAPIVANTDPNGWSILPGLPGTAGGYQRAIYVDSVGGSDSNTGDSPSQALQHLDSTSTLYQQLSSSVAKTQSIVVLLKPGSSWPTEQFNVPLGGTAAFPLLITGTMWPGNVGTARPQIGGMIYLTASHVAIEGLQIGPGGTYAEGIHIPVNGGTDFLIEDCLITHYYNLIEITGSHTQPVSNVRIRRNYLFGAEGNGPVVAFDGNDISSALFEDNFFDWNGGPLGDYTNTSLTANYSDQYAHDIYFADDGTGVVALNVTFKHNLFSRTLESVKGPYSGAMDDNLFYNYSSGGYIGTWGAQFTNNVLMNGSGFATGLDNNHGPNTLSSRKTLFCNNLSYNEGSPYAAGDYAFQTENTAGVNLEFVHNVIDGFDRAFNFSDGSCFGYDVSSNTVQANSFYEIWSPWPQAGCTLSFSDNTYHSPMGSTSKTQDGYSLKQNPAGTFSDFATLETFLDESGGTYQSAAFAFTDPTRNMTSYLTSTGLAAASSAPTYIDYLTLVRAQAQTSHQWNTALGVQAINEYLRQGHSLPGQPLTYGSGCP